MTIYILMAGTQDPESQRKGIVATVFPVRFQESPQFSFNPMSVFAKRALLAIPVKCCAIHCCLLLDEKKRLNPIQKLCIDWATRGTLPYMLPRTKLHVGKIWILVYNVDQITVFVTSLFAHSVCSLLLVRKCLDPILLLQTKADLWRFEIFYQAMEYR